VHAAAAAAAAAATTAAGQVPGWREQVMHAGLLGFQVPLRAVCSSASASAVGGTTEQQQLAASAGHTTAPPPRLPAAAAASPRLCLYAHWIMLPCSLRTSAYIKESRTPHRTYQRT
jgi:hypothetical protein